MRHKRGSKTCLYRPDTSCDRMRLIVNGSAVLRVDAKLSTYYLELLKNEVLAREGENSSSNADGGMARPGRRSRVWLMQPCVRRRNELPRAIFAKRQPDPGGAEKFAVPDKRKTVVRPARISTCDKAAPARFVMLHLRSCYVSKAAILTIPVQPVPVENRSPA